VPSREIFHAEALDWLASHPADAGMSVVTSLPDASELPLLGVDGWRAWFIGAARKVLAWLPAGGVAIFYQSDIRVGGEWIDKGYLVQRAMEEEGAKLAWHRIVCRKPAGTASFGRATYAHMLCASGAPRPKPRHGFPDVLPDAGVMPWSRAMGVGACEIACQFLLKETETTIVVDPFCGHGTVLAVANRLGLDAVGIDQSRAQCKAARNLKA
jgi:hypothetical protein